MTTLILTKCDYCGNESKCTSLYLSQYNPFKLKRKSICVSCFSTVVSRHLKNNARLIVDYGLSEDELVQELLDKEVIVHATS